MKTKKKKKNKKNSHEFEIVSPQPPQAFPWIPAPNSLLQNQAMFPFLFVCLFLFVFYFLYN